MRFIYVANIRLPTEKAHGVQIMKTCEALARQGARVTLVVPARRTPLSKDPFTYYGVEPLFTIVRLPVIDLIALGRMGFWLESLSFSIFALGYVLTRPADIFYSRDELPLFLISFFRNNTVWESHGGRLNFLIRRLLRICSGIVVITKGLEEFYALRTKLGILIAPDGIDANSFENPESKEAARARLGLPFDKKIALYVGRLDGWKGTDTLFEAARLLPSDIQIVAIGGEERQVEALKDRYPGVLFLGFRPYRELANNQAAADMLVLPNTGKDETSVRFTSPLKLFSYMAAGKPILASDLPSLREILSEKNAEFFVPDDPRSLAQAMENLFDNEERMRRIALQAKAEISHYTWDARATRILSFLRR
jgi:glycosyltransferase involved in cell wall biosynthesis